MRDERETQRVSTMLTLTDKAKLKKMAYSKGHKVAPMLRKLVRDAIAKWEQNHAYQETHATARLDELDKEAQ